MSGLYNMINGFDISCVTLLPMLGRKSEEYPRFRDCWLSDDHTHIEIYTRVGGNNRNCGFGEEKLYEDKNFAYTVDDDFDNTYAIYAFKVPDKWKNDFELIKEGKYSEVSEEYINVVKDMYPKLAEEGFIDNLFGKCEEDSYA